jgi:hypothetical protein
MERSWLETVQILGLDWMLALVLLGLALDAAYAGLVRLGHVMRRTRQDRRVAPTPASELSHSPWPPQEWRPSH